MFASRLQEVRQEVRRILREDAFPSYQVIEEQFETETALDLKDACGLLLRCIGSEKLRGRFLERIARVRKDRFANQLRLIIPQYHSSFCVDNCAYCGFRESNKALRRSRLTDADFSAEIDLILDWGYRCIEFVYSTDPELTTERIGQRVEAARGLGAERNAELQVGLNANVFEENEYRELVDAGLDFVVVWMETYSERYQRWHPGDSPKTDFSHRLNAHDRALRGGLKRYGLGVLFGLGPWIEDALMLIAHGLYLRQEYGRDPWILGIPRLRPAMGVQAEKSPFRPNDSEFLLVCAVFKAVFPEVMLFINTREPLEINLEAAKGGGDLFTVDCATYPGGYLFRDSQRKISEQFSTVAYPREATIRLLEKQGFLPVHSW